jgi:ubiquinone/menaquinone biosynthesis C-methylase UbiE
VGPEDQRLLLRGECDRGGLRAAKAPAELARSLLRRRPTQYPAVALGQSSIGIPAGLGPVSTRKEQPGSNLSSLPPGMDTSRAGSECWTSRPRHSVARGGRLGQLSRQLGVTLRPAGRRGDTVGVSQEEYLLANQPSELERLQLQSQVWEPTGRQLLSKIGSGSGGRALDVGCGAMGWLRILGEWVGPSGQVVGADIDASPLDAARSFLAAEGISNVELVVDDLFDSKLEPQSFDLVHARYQIAPLGRGPEQVASHQRLIKPGGSLVLEEWDLASWHFNPPAAAAERLIQLLSEIFARLGGEAGRGLPELLREIGVEEPEIDAHVIALKPGHPYLRLPLQFSAALESRLLETLSEDELASLRRDAETELAEPGRWGTTFTLIQSWGRLEG